MSSKKAKIISECPKCGLKISVVRNWVKFEEIRCDKNHSHIVCRHCQYAHPGKTEPQICEGCSDIFYIPPLQKSAISGMIMENPLGKSLRKEFKELEPRAFPFTRAHLEKRADITNIARVIHEILLYNPRTHEPGSAPVPISEIREQIETRFKASATESQVAAAIARLIDSGLVRFENNHFTCVKYFNNKFHTKSLELAELEEALDTARKLVSPEISSKILKKILDEVGLDEIKKQADWVRYRNNDWAKGDIVKAFFSYCRDRRPEPAVIQDKRKEAVKLEESRREESLKKKFSEWQAKKYKAAWDCMDDIGRSMVLDEAEKRLGKMFTDRNNITFRATVRLVVLDMIKAASYTDWKKSHGY